MISEPLEPLELYDLVVKKVGESHGWESLNRQDTELSHIREDEALWAFVRLMNWYLVEGEAEHELTVRLLDLHAQGYDRWYS